MLSEHEDLVYKKRDNRDIVLSVLFFRKVLKNINSAAMVTDNKGRIKFASDNFFETFGISRKNVYGKKWVSAVVPEGKNEEAEGVLEALREKDRLIRLDIPVISGKARPGTVSLVVSPLAGRGPERMYFFIECGLQKNARKVFFSRFISENEVKDVRDEVAGLIFESSEKCDPETARHALRSVFLAESLARETGLSAGKIETVRMAALLHDLGKLAVDPDILFKAGKLTRKEFDHIKKHIVWGTDLLERMFFLKDITDIIRGHHENYDGRGYPDGISGESIPFESRILSVADIYEALTADRPYRKAFSKEEAIAIMEYEKCYKLDPKLTDIFVAMIRKWK